MFRTTSQRSNAETFCSAHSFAYKELLILENHKLLFAHTETGDRSLAVTFHWQYFPCVRIRLDSVLWFCKTFQRNNVPILWFCKTFQRNNVPTPRQRCCHYGSWYKCARVSTLSSWRCTYVLLKPNYSTTKLHTNPVPPVSTPRFWFTPCA